MHKVCRVVFQPEFRERVAVQGFVIRVTEAKLKHTVKPQNGNSPFPQCSRTNVISAK